MKIINKSNWILREFPVMLISGFSWTGWKYLSKCSKKCYFCLFIKQKI